MTPKQIGDRPIGALQYTPGWPRQFGMTYRQWLVGMAMQGICASPALDGDGEIEIANQAVACADAVLAELAKDQPSA